MKSFKKILSTFLAAALGLGGISSHMVSAKSSKGMEVETGTDVEKKSDKKFWEIKEYAMSVAAVAAAVALGGKCIYEMTRPWYGFKKGNVCQDGIYFGKVMTSPRNILIEL